MVRIQPTAGQASQEHDTFNGRKDDPVAKRAAYRWETSAPNLGVYAVSRPLYAMDSINNLQPRISLRLLWSLYQ
jgi:hypothetical protein